MTEVARNRSNEPVFRGKGEVHPDMDLLMFRRRVGRFFEGAEIGSPKVLALNDYIDRTHAMIILGIRISEIKEMKTDKDSRLYHYGSLFEYNSALRMAEAMAVGIRLRIQERTAGIPGYAINSNTIENLAAEGDAILGDINAGKAEDEIAEESTVEFFEEIFEGIMSPQKE